MFLALTHTNVGEDRVTSPGGGIVQPAGELLGEVAGTAPMRIARQHPPVIRVRSLDSVPTTVRPLT